MFDRRKNVFPLLLGVVDITYDHFLCDNILLLLSYDLRFYDLSDINLIETGIGPGIAVTTRQVNYSTKVQNNFF